MKKTTVEYTSVRDNNEPCNVAVNYITPFCNPDLTCYGCFLTFRSPHWDSCGSYWNNKEKPKVPRASSHVLELPYCIQQPIFHSLFAHNLWHKPPLALDSDSKWQRSWIFRQLHKTQKWTNQKVEKSSALSWAVCVSISKHQSLAPPEPLQPLAFSWRHNSKTSHTLRIRFVHKVSDLPLF